MRLLLLIIDLIIRNYKNLKWAFKKNNKDFLNNLFDNFNENPYYLNSLEKMIRYLRNNHCKNVQEKLAFVADIWNFNSIVSELEVAVLLLENGKRVALIPDDYNEVVSPPDIYAVDDMFDVYVEVTRITNDRTIDIISDYMNEKTSFVVDVNLNENISIPAFGDERDTKKKKIKDGLEEFSKKYDALEVKEAGIEMLTCIGKFKLRESKIGKGYAGTFFWGSGIPYDKIMQKIRNDVIIKSEKRKKWKDDYLNKYYIVALDFEDIAYDPMYLESALFGSMTYFDTDPHHLIEKAQNRGWKGYLKSMQILSDYNILFPNKWGVFLTSEITKNVSGIIGKFRGKKPVFYPNPFAFDEINNPKLVHYLEKNSRAHLC
jgi:hypothetical protein